MNAKRDHVSCAVFGLLLGFGLSNIGFSQWSEVHAMFTLADLRLLFTFAGGVAIAAVVFLVLRKRHPPHPRPLHKGIVPGALLFGAGWALCGACPSIALVQLGEGQLSALLTIAGIGLGTVTYKRVLGPWLKIDAGSCEL